MDIYPELTEEEERFIINVLGDWIQNLNLRFAIGACRFLYGEDYESCVDEIDRPKSFIKSDPKPKPKHKVCNRCEFLYGEDYESCDHWFLSEFT